MQRIAMHNMQHEYIVHAYTSVSHGCTDSLLADDFANGKATNHSAEAPQEVHEHIPFFMSDQRCLAQHRSMPCLDWQDSGKARRLQQPSERAAVCAAELMTQMLANADCHEGISSGGRICRPLPGVIAWGCQSCCRLAAPSSEHPPCSL